MIDYLDETNKRQVQIARQATGILKDDVYPSINAAYRAVRDILKQADDFNSINDVDKINAQIVKATNEALTTGFAAATANMSTIAIQEAAFNAALLSSSTVALSVPSDSKIARYVRDSIMTLSSGDRKQSAIWSKYVEGYKQSFSQRYNAIITDAYSKSLSTGKMATVGRLTKQLRDISNGLLRTDAETLVRTGVQHYAARANQLLSDDNADIIEREKPIVTFDSRTSDVCISISSKYPNGWKRGESPIGYNPYHYRCRTVIGYLLYGQNDFEGTRASKGADGGKQIKASTPFAKWLRGQPKSFIVETLGSGRAELFLQGKLSLANLTNKFLNPLKIDEIKRRG